MAAIELTTIGGFGLAILSSPATSGIEPSCLGDVPMRFEQPTDEMGRTAGPTQ